MSNPLPEPAYYQWRRKKMSWTLEFAFHHRCEATTDDSEVRTLHTADQMREYAALVAAQEREACAKIAENRSLADASAKERTAHYTACKYIAAAIRARGQA